MFTGRRPRRFSVSAVLTPAILGQAIAQGKMQNAEDRSDKSYWTYQDLYEGISTRVELQSPE